MKKNHVEQAYSYAINVDIDVPYFALCNGREFILFQVKGRQPLLQFPLNEIEVYWGALEGFLGPSNVFGDGAAIPPAGLGKDDGGCQPAATKEPARRGGSGSPIQKRRIGRGLLCNANYRESGLYNPRQGAGNRRRASFKRSTSGSNSSEQETHICLKSNSPFIPRPEIAKRRSTVSKVRHARRPHTS